MRHAACVALVAIACVAAVADLRAQSAEQPYFEFQVSTPVRQLVQQPFVFAIAGSKSERPAAPPNAPAMSLPDMPPAATLPRTPAPPLGTVDGWMITQKVTVDSGDGSAEKILAMRMHGSGGRLRVEISSASAGAAGGMVMLVDSTANRRSQLMPNMQMVTVSPLVDARSATIRTEPTFASRTITDLGDGERIAGLPTRHYRIEGVAGTRVTLGNRSCVIERHATTEMWMTPDATAAAMQRNLRGVGRLLQSMAQIGQGTGMALSDMPPGTPLKSIGQLPHRGRDGAARRVMITSEITAFGSGPIDAALFEALEGYQVIDATTVTSTARIDSMVRVSMARVFARMIDSTATVPGETRTCTTTPKP